MCLADRKIANLHYVIDGCVFTLKGDVYVGMKVGCVPRLPCCGTVILNFKYEIMSDAIYVLSISYGVKHSRTL